jgi:hypothetical protein
MNMSAMLLEHDIPVAVISTLAMQRFALWFCFRTRGGRQDMSARAEVFAIDMFSCMLTHGEE